MTTMTPTTGDEWNNLAKMYKSLTTGVAVKPIASLVRHANEMLAFSQATAILDNGCGPGPIVSKVIEQYGNEIPSSTRMVAADFSQGMVDAVRAEQQSHQGQPLWDKLETLILDATDMKDVDGDSFSHITAGWVYFLTPNPSKCLTESRRVLREGGVLSLSSWAGNDWMSVMQIGAAAKEGAPSPMPQIPAEWRSVQGVEGELRKAGFRDVGAEEVQVTMAVENREQMVDFFMTSMPFVKKMLQSFTEEEVKKAKDLMMKEMLRVCPEEPGLLEGVSVVGWGRK